MKKIEKNSKKKEKIEKNRKRELIKCGKRKPKLKQKRI